MRFLLVEDNADLARALTGRFALDGHVVDHAACLADAELSMKTVSYDLILLDIMLPDGDGREFLRRHRAQDDPTPVIVLTARSEVSDRVGLLDLGADDYITKPFDFAELEARTRAVMRRLGGAAGNTREFAGLVFDSTTGTISADNWTEQLRNREMRLLEVFFAAPGQIFSKSHLMDRLFSFSEDVSENAIEVYVGRLRRKLGASEAHIETVRGLGYRMVKRG
ncbi:response regulator transcription factor [uncultured Roseobacter sp.]|uniref:response regulator transcription factor n=1 Tax=uncultured Roseobacter sp. TaxID=114847 RepID=UPI002618896B|nr:response regulator transcription factor [uncultured Roseobacter sp.]